MKEEPESSSGFFGAMTRPAEPHRLQVRPGGPGLTGDGEGRTLRGEVSFHVADRLGEGHVRMRRPFLDVLGERDGEDGDEE